MVYRVLKENAQPHSTPPPWFTAPMSAQGFDRLLIACDHAKMKFCYLEVLLDVASRNGSDESIIRSKLETAKDNYNHTSDSAGAVTKSLLG